VTDRQKLVEKLGGLAADLDAAIVTAESLTSGAIASALGQGPSASEWFRGGVIAYKPEVKFKVLGVPEGPVVTEEAAEQMARGARDLLSANWAIAVTGVGGPGSDEGEPAGTVWMAVVTDDHVTTRRVQLDGDPADVVEKTVDASLELLHEVLQKG